MSSLESYFGQRVGGIAERLGISKTMAHRLVDELLQGIAGDALNGEAIRTPIGTFLRSSTRERDIRNPVTGERMRLGETHRLAFRAAKALKGGGR